MNHYDTEKRLSQLESDLRTLRELVKQLQEQLKTPEQRGPGRPRKDQ